jgi:accessory gene regulator protein AgrB
MQNDEHDELVLFGTFVILLAGGLLQHISNLVKVVYDIVCARFNAPLLTALNTGAVYVVEESDSSKLEHTRLVLQHFGWTRVYGFFAVALCGLLSFTMSATSSLSLNPLQFITQNQYVYFVLAYGVALTGLDLFYEAIPFVTEKDTLYGEEAADRLRKLFVCIYLIFLLFSQYFVESSEK